MRFQPFLSLQLHHPYYANGSCPDFVIEPTLATQRQLKNYRCVLKSFASGIRILGALTDQGAPFLPWPKGLRFGFHLRLCNPDFGLYTDLTPFATVAAPIYTNVGLGQQAGGQLTLVSRPNQKTEQFSVTQPAEAEHFVLHGQPLAGLQPPDFSVAGLASATHITQFDAAAKMITVNSSTVRQGTTFTVAYATAPSLQRGIFAEVEIEHDDAQSVTIGAQQFSIPFAARRARWSYYLVAKPTTATFRIEDRDTPPLVFSEANRTLLNDQPDPTDAIATALAEQFPQLQRWRFVSDDVVACHQQGRKQLQLYLNGDQVMGALTAPSPRNYAAIEVSKNGNRQKEDALFQVIKFLVQ